MTITSVFYLAVDDQAELVLFAALRGRDFGEARPQDELEFGGILLAQVDEGGGVGEELAAVADVDGRFDLVAREHPDFDAGFEEHVDRFGHALGKQRKRIEFERIQIRLL